MFINVRLPDGSTHRLEAVEGWRVMEVIRDWGLPIKAECGGACACATCHVWVAENWVDKLVPPTEEETEMLDGAFSVDEERSRLCCQLIMTPELDGLFVRFAHDHHARTTCRICIAPCTIRKIAPSWAHVAGFRPTDLRAERQPSRTATRPG